MFFESIAAYQFDFTVKDWTAEKASQTIEKLVNSLDTIDGDEQEVVDEIRNCIVVDKHTNKDWSLDGVELSQTANNLANKLDTWEKVPKGIKIPNTAINNGHWIKTDLTYDSTTFELVVTDFEANDYIRYIIDNDDEKDEVMEERSLQSALKTLSQSKVTKNWKPQFKKRISSKVSPFTTSILETITKARTEHYTLTKKGPTSGPRLELVWNKQTGTYGTGTYPQDYGQERNLHPQHRLRQYRRWFHQQFRDNCKGCYRIWKVQTDQSPNCERYCKVKFVNDESHWGCKAYITKRNGAGTEQLR